MVFTITDHSKLVDFDKRLEQILCAMSSKDLSEKLSDKF